MDGDRPQSRRAGGAGVSGSLSMLRAGAVLVAFVIAVVVLVAVGTRPSVSSTPSALPTTPTTVASGTTTSAPPTTAPGSTSSAPASTTTTRAGHHSTASTTTTNVSHAATSVVVANGTTTNGLAAHYTSTLGAAGWNMKTPVDTTSNVTTSAVYYASGQQKAAQSVASAIGVKPSQVLPLTSSVPVNGVTGTDVVVVIGQDLSTTTTTVIGS
jgi:LytR cell envelope-related transcriptional attenuator